MSLKKLLAGDGSWGTRKLILGWIIDSVRQTIELPPHRKETLHQIVTELAVIDVTPDGLLLKEIACDTTLDAVLAATGATLRVADPLGRF